MYLNSSETRRQQKKVTTLLRGNQADPLLSIDRIYERESTQNDAERSDVHDAPDGPAPVVSTSRCPEQLKKECIFAATAGRTEVMGMATLEDNLFVICKRPPNIIFKYNLKKFQQEPVELAISEAVYPRGMASSEQNKCLYMTDYNSWLHGGRLWRYKYELGTERKREKPVAEIDMEPFGVSVSKHGYVVVTCSHTFLMTSGKVIFYRQDKGRLLIHSTVMLSDLSRARQTILVPCLGCKQEQDSEPEEENCLGNYIVCHGWGSLQRHGLTVYHNCKGNNRSEVYGIKGQGNLEFDCPLSVTLDDCDNILVVDYYNHRIQQLTSDMKFVRHLVTREQHGIKWPRHVCHHSGTKRLYVGQYDGTIHVFSICGDNIT